jgi:hypothetical protein
VYLDILEEALPKMPPGAVVLAHNSVNAAERLKHYLEFVRGGGPFAASVNVVLDPEGLGGIPQSLRGSVCPSRPCFRRIQEVK